MAIFMIGFLGSSASTPLPSDALEQTRRMPEHRYRFAQAVPSYEAAC